MEGNSLFRNFNFYLKLLISQKYDSMKEIIYQSKFQEIIKKKEEDFFHISWYNTSKMLDNEYREDILEQVRCYQEYKVKGSLIDTSTFEFAIVPKTQEWANENVFPVAAKAGLQFVALLVPEDFYAQLSIEQYVEEDKENLLQFHYFNSVEEARNWLMKETSDF